MLYFVFGMIVGCMFFEPLIINLIFFSNIDFFMDIILTKKNKNKLINHIKENEELRQPQVFIDCEDMEERYGRDLYEDYLKGKIEQLENIKKEAIDYLKKREYDNYSCSVCSVMSDDLLNILNKERKIKDV